TPVLRTVAKEIDANYPDLNKLISNMWETMYYSHGVGLAAPQINKSIRLFVVDSLQILNNLEEDEKAAFAGQTGIKEVFINPKLIELSGKEWPYNEGCLSIPKIREDIYRHETVTLQWLDKNFEPQKAVFSGITARVILHEYDHLEGKLFIDYLKPLKRKLLGGKLADISKGKVKVDYKMVFHK
ncbi:MAG: peptide deformylase, partial [Chitinophagaceae bacterium]